MGEPKGVALLYQPTSFGELIYFFVKPLFLEQTEDRVSAFIDEFPANAFFGFCELVRSDEHYCCVNIAVDDDRYGKAPVITELSES